MAQIPFTLRRWTRAEYDELIGIGVFESEPLELIGGELIVAEPKSPPHATGVGLAGDAIRAVLPSGWSTRTQAPVSLDHESEPEPVVVVVAGQPRDYRYAHPTQPSLVVEVADASLDFDRRRKGSLYARARVDDYWIVNLVDRVLEICRDPVPDPSAFYGWRYRSVSTLASPAVASPLAFPSVRTAVSDLLP